MKKSHLKIALIGYGKMGRLIDQAASQQGAQVVERISTKNKIDLLKNIDQKNVNVCIDFSHPDAVLETMKIAAEKKLNVVMGTTGWERDAQQVKDLVEESGIGFIYSPNFSIGVNLFVQMVEKATQMMNNHPMYDAAVAEIHHRQKVDAPSGTAKWIGQTVLNNLARKSKISEEPTVRPDELQISTQRCGYVPGTHIVTFDSPVDSIILTHEARNREGFANGSIVAAEWLRGKQGFFTMADMLHI